MVIRQNPINCSSYVLITRTGFWDDPNSVSQTGLKLPGVVSKLVFLSVLSFKNKPFVEDPNYIKGLKGNLEILTNLQEFGTLTRDPNENVDILNLHKIPQAFVCIFKTELFNQTHISQLNDICNEITANPYDFLTGTTFEGLNHLLWRCSNEELDISDKKRDVYAIPNYRRFNYAGIGSLVSEFLKLLGKNRLGHAICNNIREGN